MVFGVTVVRTSHWNRVRYDTTPASDSSYEATVGPSSSITPRIPTPTPTWVQPVPEEAVKRVAAAEKNPRVPLPPPPPPQPRTRHTTGVVMSWFIATTDPSSTVESHGEAEIVVTTTSTTSTTTTMTMPTRIGITARPTIPPVPPNGRWDPEGWDPSTEHHHPFPQRTNTRATHTRNTHMERIRNAPPKTITPDRPTSKVDRTRNRDSAEKERVYVPHHPFSFIKLQSASLPCFV
mgnify:CR=1 FL=1